MNDLTFEGVTQAVSEWALDYGIPGHMISNRIRSGWTVARAITTPMPAKPGDRLAKGRVYKKRPSITHDGQTLTIAEWSRVTGLSKPVIAYRVANGWTPANTLELPVIPRSGRRTKEFRG